MKRRIFIIGAAITSITAIAAATYRWQKSDIAKQDLDTFHQTILKRYPTVNHVPTYQLTQLNAENTLIFDVREQDEFEVSHISNAIRIPPQMSPEDFLNRFGENLNNKLLIFYCSVGERSSRFTELLTVQKGTLNFEAANLKGGLFKWHNENRPVTNKHGSADAIHPYN